MSLKNDIINKKNASMKSIMIEHFLDSLFKKELEDKEERYGLHASAIIASDNEFCYREQVLSLFFKRNIGKELSTDLLKIFAAGTSIHEKWQNLFKKCGIAVTIEKTRFDKRYDLCFTPDATINYNGEEIPVEIKSMNTFSFQKANSHPSGEKQLNFYLYLLKKKWGFVLAEDKNTQKNIPSNEIKNDIITISNMKNKLLNYNFEYKYTISINNEKIIYCKLNSSNSNNEFSWLRKEKFRTNKEGRNKKWCNCS